MKMKYVKYLRVSTTKQEHTGLGLDEQSDVIDYFVRGGEIIATFVETYTGTSLRRCAELQKAIDFCKANQAKLIMYKSDRFRNVREALEVLDELGEGNLVCCDLPNADRFTFTLFFAIAEREALLISLRTKAALKHIKKRIRENGYYITRQGKKITSLGCPNVENLNKYRHRRDATISADKEKRRQYLLMLNLRNKGYTLKQIADSLNEIGEKTPTGKQWNAALTQQAFERWSKYEWDV